MSHADQIEIPLFPLSNVVLFPRVMLPLHIFEERYKAMIGACIEEGSPFGVVLCRGAEETPSSIQRIGVLARVGQVERLDDGRMNIMTEGEERFQIVKFTASAPSWRALVELVADRPESAAALETLRDEVGALYMEAYRKGVELTGERPGNIELPDSAADLSFMVSYVLDLDYEEKQRLLEMTSTRQRLAALVGYLKGANERLGQQVQQKRMLERARGNGDLGRPGVRPQ